MINSNECSFIFLSSTCSSKSLSFKNADCTIQVYKVQYSIYDCFLRLNLVFSLFDLQFCCCLFYNLFCDICMIFFFTIVTFLLPFATFCYVLLAFADFCYLLLFFVIFCFSIFLCQFVCDDVF